MNNSMNNPVEQNGLVISLRADKLEYHLQETIHATVRFTNASREDFLLNTRFQTHSIEYWFRFEDMNGKAYDQRFSPPPRGDIFGVYGFTYLQTKEAIEVTDPVYISDYIEEPGTYNLFVIYYNDSEPDLEGVTLPWYETRTTWKGTISTNSLIHVVP